MTWTAFLVADIRTVLPMISPLMSADANHFLGDVLDPQPTLDLAGYTNVLMTRQNLMREWAQCEIAPICRTG